MGRCQGTEAQGLVWSGKRMVGWGGGWSCEEFGGRSMESERWSHVKIRNMNHFMLPFHVSDSRVRGLKGFNFQCDSEEGNPRVQSRLCFLRLFQEPTGGHQEDELHA